MKKNNVDMKIAGMKISLLMGLTMSFCLSLIGMLSSGQFTVPGFLKSFAISFVISTVLGLLLPIKKISTSLCKKHGLAPGSVKGRIVDALITDLLYSPIMTLIMVYMAWKQATSHGARIPFGGMLLKAEIISFVAAFILGYAVAPVYESLIMKEFGT